MTKILFVITKANWGGAQRYVYDLATNLPHDRFDIAVAFGQPGRLAQELAQASIRALPIGSLQRDISAGSDTKSFFELYRLFKKERPDVVHLNSSKAGGVGALAARLAGIRKIVFTAHGWPFREQRTIIVRGIFWLTSWLTALFATNIICVSEYDLHQARRMPFVGHKAVRIYNGIDQSVPLGSGDIIRTAFPAGATITGTIGELTKNKNQMALVEQAKKDPSLCVAIVGEGELRPLLEKKISEYGLQDRVKLFGFLPARDVLKGFDVFALPSIKEGLPYVLLEAKAAGLPIETNRSIGGIAEILDKPLGEFSLERMVAHTAQIYESES
ncbi:MAG TPA: glycosyltransferase [Candidatus Paceibacterota bacterium]|nr:glycosyltransferase [Candidatus Paceibacterota bacterium]